MLSNETIVKLSAQFQTSELNLRREYFQHLFLSLFYQQEGMDEVFFKGGTALRLIYNSPRFSEDLDFDSPLPDVKRIESAIVSALAEAQKDGTKTELDEAKETSGGYLSTMRFSALGYTIPIRIEISFRERKREGSPAIIASDIFPEYTLMQLNEEQLADGKIRALLDRKKPRDFYDFYFLLRHNMLPEKNKGEILRQALDVLEKSSFQFDDDLKEFLPKSHHMIIRDFRKMLERDIGRYIR